MVLTITWEQRKFEEFVKSVAVRNKNNLDLEPYAVTNDRGFISQKEAHDDFGYMKDVDRTAYNIVPPNSFAYNPARINVGSIGYYSGGENVIVSSLYEVFQTADYIDDRFLWHWFKSDYFPKWIDKLQEGSVRLYFYFDKLVQCEMYFPSLEEQRKISLYLDNLDNLITLHQRKFFIIFKNLITWEQRKLGEVFEQTSNLVNPDDSNIELWSLTVEDGLTPKSERYNREFLVKKENNFKEVRPGDIVYNPMNMTLGAVGYNGMAKSVAVSGYYTTMIARNNYDAYYINTWLKSPQAILLYKTFATGSLIEKQRVQFPTLSIIPAVFPDYEEQKKIGHYFEMLDNLITLHQRVPPISIKEDLQMQETIVKTNILFCDYYKQWIDTYKKGAIRDVTMDKYNMAYEWLKKLVPDLCLSEITRTKYQQLLNEYAEKHEHQTTMDFHHHIKCALLDAVDEGLLERDPTRKAIIKGKEPSKKKIKFLNQFELQKLLGKLDLGPSINWDWFILLIAKTGLRFSEALALTPADFDFSHQILSINKTWNYKGNRGFLPAKNKSSVRKIQLDWMTVMQFTSLLRESPDDKPIFIMDNAVYNSTVNDLLERRCKAAEIPIISIHGLRHTHASQLLFAGVSIASVARRLGHSSMTTTQKTYLHIIQELENKDIDLIMRSLSSLN